MILLKFNLEDFDDVKNVDDVYRAMGIAIKDTDKGEASINDEEVFGTKPYYANMFMDDGTFNYIADKMKKLDKESKVSGYAFQWANLAPISNGPRYEKVKELVGEINRTVLYIITPEDELYEECPEED